MPRTRTVCGRRRRHAATLVVALAALATAGCSGSDGGAAATGAAATSAGTTGDATTGDASAAAGDAQSGASAPETALPVIAVRTTSDNGIPLKMSLHPVAVSGQLMTVSVTATNTGDPQDRDRWQVRDFFSNGVYDAKGDLLSAEANSADGIYVLDPTNGKRHLVGRGPDQLCACSLDLGGTFVAAGNSTTVTATFGAPPAEVTSVTVVVPGVPAFSNVPVGR